MLFHLLTIFMRKFVMRSPARTLFLLVLKLADYNPSCVTPQMPFSFHQLVCINLCGMSCLILPHEFWKLRVLSTRNPNVSTLWAGNPQLYNHTWGTTLRRMRELVSRTPRSNLFGPVRACMVGHHMCLNEVPMQFKLKLERKPQRTSSIHRLCIP